MTREEVLSGGGWGKNHLRRDRIITVLAIFAAIAFPLSIAALVVGLKNETRITRVEHTACAKNPESRACQQLKAETDRNQPTRFACIQFENVGYPCPGPEYTGPHNTTPYKGGGSSNGGNNPPSSQPSPPATGGGQTTPPASESANPGVLNPVTESPVVKPLIPECHITALGIEICN